MKNSINKIILLIFIVFSMVFIPVRDTKANSREAVTRYVASVTIYSTINNDHSWLVVRNLSGSAIKVGKMIVNNGDSVSLGTFGNISQHKGIWYNIELTSKVSTSVSLTSIIETTTQLNTLNNKINSRDSWGITNNTCATFAAVVWNSVFDKKVSVGITPSSLANSIKGYSYSTNANMPTKTSNDIYYHTSSGVVHCPSPTFTGSSSLSRSINNELTSFSNHDLNVLERVE